MKQNMLALSAFVLVWGVIVAASVTLTGSGNIGKLGPGWAVSEQCTPVAPGDTSGSVGSASLDAFARSTSLFAIDNDLILTDPSSGTFRGNVVASPVTGRKVHLDVAGKLNSLVADRTVDPVWFDGNDPLFFGQVGTATGQFTQPGSIATDPFDGSTFVMSYGGAGVGRYVVVKFDVNGTYVTEFGSFGTANGQFGGLSGVAVSPVDGSVAVGDGANQRVQIFTPNGARTTYTYSTKQGTLGAGDGQFGGSSTIPVAYDSLGALFAGDRGNQRIQKFTISGVTVTYITQQGMSGFGFGATPHTAPYSVTVSSNDVVWVSAVKSLDSVAPGAIRSYNSSLGAPVTFALDAPAGTAAGILGVAADATGVWVNWGLSNYLTHYTVTGSVLVEDNRWYSGYPSAGDLNSNYGIAVKPSGEVMVLLKSTTFQTAPGLYGDYRVTSFDWNPVPLSAAIEGYMLECDATLGGMVYSYDAALNPAVIFPAWSGDVWAHLKEICAAYALEIYLDNNTIRVEDVGARTIVLKNHTPLRIVPSNIFGGQQLIMVAQNPRAGGGTVFDASAQNTRFQIDVGQSVPVIVNTINYPVTVDTLAPTDVLPILPGQYYVLDSTGTHVPASTWLDAGASVTPALGDSPGQIKFTLKGPTSAMSGYTGPFTFADSITSTGRAALTLTGTGVFTTPKSYTFETGANPTKTTQLVARTINSFAIADMAQIFKIVPAAIDDVSGVNVTVQFEMPTADLLGFGLTTGSLFTAEDSKYRVTAVQFGGLKASISAVRHITIDDVDTATAGLTVDQRDDIWAGYSIDDRGIKPLALIL